jgi:SAM-dependent methyltransferase
MSETRQPLDADRARHWLERWDRQQESYIPDREARFAVLLDTLATLVPRPDPLVVDLGVGPGSLAHRLLDRVPAARVVGVDADPLLIGLGEAARPDDRIRLVQADLRDPGWYDALGLDRAPDAYVSSTALHWMDRLPLRDLIATCGRTLAPGGVFLDADHLYEGDPALDDLGRALTRLRGTAAGTADGELWQPWWDAVAAAPELAGLVAAREAAGFEHVVEDRPTVHDYLDALRAAGFTTVGQVWQYGDDRVIVGAMPG